MKIFCLVFMLLGTFVGAGFVSGREISRFFSSFGLYSYLSIILSCILLAILLIFFFSISHNVRGFSEFVSVYFGKYGKVVLWLFSISLLIFSATMISGCNEITEVINCNKYIVMAITIIFCFKVVLSSVRGLSIVNIFLIPLLIIFLIHLNLTKSFHVINNSFNIYTIIDGFFYIFINIVSIGMFILEVGYKYSRKEYILSIFIFVSIICFLMLLMNNCIQINNLQNEVMPMLTLAKSKGEGFGFVMILFLWLGLFTTLSSCVFILVNILPLRYSQSIKMFIVLMVVVLFGFMSFDMMVNYIYLIIGIIGFLLVIITSLRKKGTKDISS